MSQSAASLRIGGLARLSTCDWPGELAATIFCQGCAWNCAYCHNPGLRPANAQALIPWPTLCEFLDSRKGLLDAVVFSGGEPTLQPSLQKAIEEVHQLGFRIGLHTAGPLPEQFSRLLSSLNWVGFDIKAPRAEYARITGEAHSGEAAFTSLRALLTSGIAYEVRTTVAPELLSSKDLLTLQSELLSLGVEHYVLQRYREQGVRANNMLTTSTWELPENFGGDFKTFLVR